MLTYKRLSPVHTRSIHSNLSIPSSLERSKAASIISADGPVVFHDMRRIVLPLCDTTFSNEEVLSRFVKGFFGGYVFWPEQYFLRALRKEIVHFDTLRDIPISSQIWSQAQLSREKLPGLHSLLFGGFRVVDCSIRESETPLQSSPWNQNSGSYIDFVLGSDSGSIRGVHRFSVFRSGIEKSNDEATCDIEKDHEKKVSLTIEFSTLTCLPGMHGFIGLNAVYWFHLQYAMMLFRDGVKEIIT